MHYVFDANLFYFSSGNSNDTTEYGYSKANFTINSFNVSSKIYRNLFFGTNLNRCSYDIAVANYSFDFIILKFYC